MDEQAEQLQSYIRQQIQSGLEPDEIHAHLQASGWPPETVQQAFLAVQATMIPTALQSQPQAQPLGNPPVASAPQALGTRRGRIKTGWLLLKQSVHLLNGNKYLLRYLLMTYVWVLILTLVLIGIYLADHQLLYTENDGLSVVGYIVTFISYVVINFAIDFYAAALAANMLGIFQGKREPFSTYTRLARSKAPTILVFSLMQATVGMILKFVIERLRYVGKILSWLLGTLWSLGTMFVLPIIITSDTSAPRAVKESVNFFKSTWGENITAKVTVNTPLFFINLAVACLFYPLIITTLVNGSIVAFWIVVSLYTFVQLSIAVVGSFANSLINVSLFYYAKYHQVPPSFEAELLNKVFVAKKNRFF